MGRQNFDMRILRTLVVFSDVGSLTQASRIVGRSQSAISLQLQKLEDQAGQKLFRRMGRNLELTEEGELLLSYARRIMALNDEAALTLRQSPLTGRLRFGMQQDFSETCLPKVISEFAKTNPNIVIDVKIGSGISMVRQIETGRLDVALTLGLGDRKSAHVVDQIPLVWIAGETYTKAPGEPLNLITFDRACRFRRQAIEALDIASVPWRIALTSVSLGGVLAAVRVGLGVTIRTYDTLGDGLIVVNDKLGLPEIGTIDISFHYSNGQLSEQSKAFLKIMRQTLTVHLARLKGLSQI